MVKSEVGVLDNNIFFPCISNKKDSIHSNSESDNAYGSASKLKTKRKSRLTSTNFSARKINSLYNSQNIDLQNLLNDTKESVAIKFKNNPNYYEDNQSELKELVKPVSPFKQKDNSPSSEIDFETSMDMTSSVKKGSLMGFSPEKHNNGIVMHRSFAERQNSDRELMKMKNRINRLQYEVERSEKIMRQKEKQRSKFNNARELHNRDLYIKQEENSKRMQILRNENERIKELYKFRRSNFQLIKSETINLKKSIKDSVSMDLRQQFQERNKNLYQDFQKRKDLHDSITKFKNDHKMHKIRSYWNTEELLYNKFEQRMKGHHDTIAKNDKLIIKLKETETEFMDKLKRTIEKQNSITSY